MTGLRFARHDLQASCRPPLFGAGAIVAPAKGGSVDDFHGRPPNMLAGPIIRSGNKR